MSIRLHYIQDDPEILIPNPRRVLLLTPQIFLVVQPVTGLWLGVWLSIWKPSSWLVLDLLGGRGLGGQILGNIQPNGWDEKWQRNKGPQNQAAGSEHLVNPVPVGGTMSLRILDPASSPPWLDGLTSSLMKEKMTSGAQIKQTKMWQPCQID